MQLSSIDRTPNPRPAGADLAVPAGARVVPVAPVNPSAQATASVVYKINTELQNKLSEINQAVQMSNPDPLKGGASADNSNKDWTQRQPGPEKVQQAPAKESISKMLMEHMQNIWSASAKAVEVVLMNNQGLNQNQARVQGINQANSQDPVAQPGVIARENLTYSPSKVKKNEQI
jgi:hypothetical protein